MRVELVSQRNDIDRAKIALEAKAGGPIGPVQYEQVEPTKGPDYIHKFTAEVL